MQPSSLQSQIVNPKSKNPRGAQPHNRNAFKHGLYSSREPSLFSSPITLASLRTTPGLPPHPYDLAILHLRESLLQYLLTEPKSPDVPTLAAWQRPVLKAIDSIRRLTVASVKSRQSHEQLFFAASNALQLIRWGFHQEGITRDADSFREKDELCAVYSPSPLPHQGSASGLPFLTDIQWAILEPLLPQSTIGNLKSSIKRGRPESDPRLLLNLILWKLAYHTPWSDLVLSLSKFAGPAFSKLL